MNDLHLSAPWKTLEREASSGLLCISDAVKLVAAVQALQAENVRLRDALSVFARGGLVAIVADARDNGRAKHSDWGRGYADACDDILKWLGVSSVVPKEEG